MGVTFNKNVIFTKLCQNIIFKMFRKNKSYVDIDCIVRNNNVKKYYARLMSNCFTFYSDTSKKIFWFSLKCIAFVEFRKKNDTYFVERALVKSVSVLYARLFSTINFTLYTLIVQLIKRTLRQTISLVTSVNRSSHDNYIIM